MNGFKQQLLSLILTSVIKCKLGSEKTSTSAIINDVTRNMNPNVPITAKTR